MTSLCQENNSLEILRFKLQLQCGVASTGQRQLYPAISGHPPVSALEELGLGKCPSCLAGRGGKGSDGITVSGLRPVFFSPDDVGLNWMLGVVFLRGLGPLTTTPPMRWKSSDAEFTAMASNGIDNGNIPIHALP